MTSLLSPPRRFRPVPGTGGGKLPAPAPLTSAAVVAALRAAALGLVTLAVLVILGWATAADSGASATEAVRAALRVWLVAHHVPLGVRGGTLALMPLGLLALPAVLLAYAGRRAVRQSRPVGRREHALLVCLLAGTYAAAATGIAAVARTPEVRPSLPLAFLAGLVLAGAAGGWGAARESGVVHRLSDRVPVAARHVLAGAAAGVGVLVAAGALLGAVAVGLHGHRVGVLAQALEPGLLGGVLLLVLCVLLVPNAALAGAAMVVGPGFAVGHGTSVTLFAADLGGVPALPLLGALPRSGPLPVVLLVGFVAPVLAGVLTALVTLRRHESAPATGADASTRTPPKPRAAMARCAGAAGVAGIVLGGLVALAGGPVGGGRMAAVGASPWQVALAAALELALVAAATAYVVTRRPLSVTWTLTD